MTWHRCRLMSIRVDLLGIVSIVSRIDRNWEYFSDDDDDDDDKDPLISCLYMIVSFVSLI